MTFKVVGYLFKLSKQSFLIYNRAVSSILIVNGGVFCGLYAEFDCSSSESSDICLTLES